MTRRVSDWDTKPYLGVGGVSKSGGCYSGLNGGIESGD